MTNSMTIDGVDVTDRIDIDGGYLEIVTMADHGAVGASGVKIDDPGGDLDLTGWADVHIEESACSQPRLFTGYLGERAISRGDASNRTGASRIHDATLVDLNAALSFRVLLPSSENKRPYESEPDRMAFLLASRAMASNPHIYDEGLIDTSGGQFFDEADFGKAYAGMVLDSMASTSKNFYVYRDHATGHKALFWDQPDAPVRDCTLQLSNVRTDVDYVTTFPVYRDAVLRRAPDETYSGVLLAFAGNQSIYRTNDTTADTFVARDYLYDSSRIMRLATAEANATTFLSLHAIEFDTITCTVQLPPEAVGLIEAGQRIKVRFSHLPGYEDAGGTWMRIVATSLVFTPGSTEFYLLTLELSMRQLVGSGGGPGGGGTPLPPDTGECVPDYTTDKMLAATITASGSPLPSNPSYANDGNASTFTTINPGVSGAGTHDSYWDCDMGSAMILSHFEVDRTPPGSGTPIVEHPGTGGTVTWRLWFSDNGSSWTEDTAYTYTTVPVAPSGTYAVISTSETTAHRYWRWHREYVLTGLQFIKQHSFYRFSFFECVAPDPVPPASQQFTQWLKIADGDGSTTTFTFPFPFADYSLEVRYDTVDQTNAIASFDGTTGDFTMEGPALTGQQVFARAQGR